MRRYMSVLADLAVATFIVGVVFGVVMGGLKLVSPLVEPAPAHAQVNPLHTATDNLEVGNVAYVTRDAENVFWQISDGVPMILVVPIFPSMTYINDGYVDVKADHAPVYWRQVACFAAEDPPFDPNTSYLSCVPFSGLSRGDWWSFRIIMADVQTLFDNRGYAIGGVK